MNSNHDQTQDSKPIIRPPEPQILPRSRTNCRDNHQQNRAIPSTEQKRERERERKVAAEGKWKDRRLPGRREQRAKWSKEKAKQAKKRKRAPSR